MFRYLLAAVAVAALAEAATAGPLLDRLRARRSCPSGQCPPSSAFPAAPQAACPCGPACPLGGCVNCDCPTAARGNSDSPVRILPASNCPDGKCPTQQPRGFIFRR